jgi:hypothetical protein
MPTSAEIKKVLRPLVERRPDLAVHGRAVFFAPFTHYLRGAIFMSARSTKNPHIVQFVNQLCTGWTTFDVNMRGRDAYEYRLFYEWDSNDLEKASPILCEEIERRALPALEPITDYSEHLRRLPHHYLPDSYRADQRRPPSVFPLHALNSACHSCARGDFDAAEELLAATVANHELHSPPIPVTDALRYSDIGLPFVRSAYLLHTLRTDRSQVLPLLHDWEAFTVNACRLTRYWKSSPFFCEV